MCPWVTRISGGLKFVCVDSVTCSQQVRERLYSLSRLDELKDLTFNTFQARGRKGLGEMQSTSLEMAFNQAQHYSKA